MPETPSTEPISRYKIAGLELKVYANRITIRKGIGPWGSEETLLFRAIASVEAGRTKYGLTIVTTDGTKHVYSVPPARAIELRDVILAQL